VDGSGSCGRGSERQGARAQRTANGNGRNHGRQERKGLFSREGAKARRKRSATLRVAAVLSKPLASDFHGTSAAAASVPAAGHSAAVRSAEHCSARWWRARRRSCVKSLLIRKGTERTACLCCGLATWRLGVEEWMGVGRAVAVLNAKAPGRKGRRTATAGTTEDRKGKASSHAKARRKRSATLRVAAASIALLAVDLYETGGRCFRALLRVADVADPQSGTDVTAHRLAAGTPPEPAGEDAYATAREDSLSLRFGVAGCWRHRRRGALGILAHEVTSAFFLSCCSARCEERRCQPSLEFRTRLEGPGIWSFRGIGPALPA